MLWVASRSRVQGYGIGMHHLTDVVGGAINGLACAELAAGCLVPGAATKPTHRLGSPISQKLSLILLSTAIQQDRPREWGWQMNQHGAKAATEAADENAKSALAVTVPAATKDEGQSTAEVGDAGAAGVGSAVRMLALAQKLHDEYVAEGQNTREKLISEGQSRHDALIAEAQQKRAEVLQELGSERSLLQKEIEELRTFERDHRMRLKSYLEGQLIELEQTGADQTG